MVWAEALSGLYHSSSGAISIGPQNGVHLSGSYALCVDADPGPDSNVLKTPFLTEVYPFLIHWAQCENQSKSVPILRENGRMTSTEIADSYQWISCTQRQAVPGATDSTFAPPVCGDYALQIVDRGCTHASPCFEASFSNESDLTPCREARLYPNPTAGSIWLDLGIVTTGAKLTVLDRLGRVVMDETVDLEPAVHVELDLPAGLYLLRVETANRTESWPVVKY